MLKKIFALLFGCYLDIQFDNKLYFGEHIQFPKSMTEEEIMLLFDPQTSGGLLFSVDPNQLDSLISKAEKMDQPIWVIGEVVEGDEIIVK